VAISESEELVLRQVL